MRFEVGLEGDVGELRAWHARGFYLRLNHVCDWHTFSSHNVFKVPVCRPHNHFTAEKQNQTHLVRDVHFILQWIIYIEAFPPTTLAVGLSCLLNIHINMNCTMYE